MRRILIGNAGIIALFVLLLGCVAEPEDDKKIDWSSLDYSCNATQEKAGVCKMNDTTLNSIGKGGRSGGKR